MIFYCSFKLYAIGIASFLLPLIIILAIAISLIIIVINFKKVKKWLSGGILKIGKALKALSNKKENKKEGYDALEEEIEIAGYAYDSIQDIFYSTYDAWQRKFGFCRLYDEAAATWGMIIDCEPIYFEYAGKNWLIEFWKGQYDLTSGGEIGVYYTEEPELNIPGVFNGTFYKSVSDEDMLQFSYILSKNGKEMFRRSDRHWWLTGFKLGEFAEPWELVMDLTVELKDSGMRDAFIQGLKEAGYTDNEIFIYGNIVGLRYDKPRTKQPYTRTKFTDKITQIKNREMCEMYQDLTRNCDTIQDKLNTLREKAPDFFDLIMNLGKSKHIFDAYEKIKDFLF
ncbi:MAG: DUF4474 domain-containing protein [Bacillota bacterium]